MSEINAMAWQEQHHPNSAQMCAAMVRELGALITDALAARGRATLALAGGRTPLPLYRALAALPLRWDAVTLIPTDERWVNTTDPASNVRELRVAFAAADGVNIVSLLPETLGPIAAAEFANAQLVAQPQAFDGVILGMGADGHFASLFPGAVALAAGLDRNDSTPALVVVPAVLPADAPFARISLSLSRLLHSRRRLLLISGTTKLEVLSRAKGQVPPEVLPISALLHDPTHPLDVHWSP